MSSIVIAAATEKNTGSASGVNIKAVGPADAVMYTPETNSASRRRASEIVYTNSCTHTRGKVDTE